MNGELIVDGRKYQVEFSICRGSKAARENGQPLWPDEPDYIDDLSVRQQTPRGIVEVTSERKVNRVYDKLMEDI